jgi:hypothetical protein
MRFRQLVYEFQLYGVEDFVSPVGALAFRGLNHRFMKIHYHHSGRFRSASPDGITIHF